MGQALNYDELCKSIGIDREAITKACADPVNTSVCKEPMYFRKNMGKRYKPPIEDLSRFVSPLGQRVAQKLRKS